MRRGGIKERYLFYKATGKLPYKAGRIDETYYDTMEQVAELNNTEWNRLRREEGGRELSVDEEYLRILNDNSYDYKGYYNKYPKGKGNAIDHWDDEFKTVYHPTFSILSKYSGNVSQYNPEGVLGGQWLGDLYVPAWGQKLPHYEDGKDAGIQRYIDATLDEQNGRYFEQSFFNNPVILFLDPSGISGYHQVNKAFENGNTYDKVVAIMGAIPVIGKLKPFSRIGGVVNIPSDIKSYSDWSNYYNDIIYTDTEHGQIGPRIYIGSADTNIFNKDVSSGKIRRATPDEVRWWYNYNKGQSRTPSPIMPPGSIISKIAKSKTK